MGQSSSSEGRDTLSQELDFIHEQIRKHSLTIRQLTVLSYEDLIAKIGQLNALSSKFVDCNGKQLLFEVKPGSDSNVLWKGTVRIKCVKFDPNTQRIDKSRELNLKQFLQVYNTMQQHLTAGKEPEEENSEATETEPEEEPECCSSSGRPRRKPKNTPLLSNMNTSIILDKVTEMQMDPTRGVEDCCICMERKPEVSLPCTHSYCLACIEQWNVNHKTCPICREKLETTDDTWVLEEMPDPQDVSKEIQRSLFGLTR